MPTTAKLAAAIWFALIGLVAANAFLPVLGESAGGSGMLLPASAAIGLVCGWIVMGGAIGKGMADAVAGGLQTVAVMVFFALLIFSAREMISEAFKMRYDGPVEAMLGWAVLMMKNGQSMLTVGVVGALAVGALVGGPLCEWVGRRWR
ncbi:TrgA family protein [Xinfangfangia sp. D13-10-4-6]|uniref:TrgA family protein n=1 Tax=Pseudogemmobacter hezensis TaxID=2737662 RepID=UPI0015539B34|nr:TrgA family protein [Pseudogemmobacter hezensis]NPD13802.1 TrgA family protein [Pseudogemmobacter hezensis]